MNRRFRRSRFRAGVALLAVSCSLWSAWLVVVHGSLGDDSACAAESGLLVAHHPTSIGHAPGGISAQHCYICHWLRSLQAVSGDAPPALPSVARAGFVSPDPITREGHVGLVHLLARSPPA
jgi:hypothetical protein